VIGRRGRQFFIETKEGWTVFRAALCMDKGMGNHMNKEARSCAF